MICLDSDIIIDFLKGNKEAVNMVKKYKDEIVTTEINAFEVFFGVYRAKHINEEEKRITSRFFSSAKVLSCVDNWGEEASKILTRLLKEGKTINENDCFIASIMLKNNCNKILTKNKSHFSRIRGLKVISY